MCPFCVCYSNIYTTHCTYIRVQLEIVNWLFNILYQLSKFGNNLLIDQLFDERS